MINSCSSRVFCRIDTCKEKHHRLLHAINQGINNKSISNNTTENYQTQNYQTNQHTAFGLHEETSKLLGQSEATVNTQIGVQHLFLHIIPLKLANGHNFIVNNCGSGLVEERRCTKVKP